MGVGARSEMMASNAPPDDIGRGFVDDDVEDASNTETETDFSVWL